MSYFSYFCSKHRLLVHIRTASPALIGLAVSEEKIFEIVDDERQSMGIL